jgi:hypothetical protein
MSDATVDYDLLEGKAIRLLLESNGKQLSVKEVFDAMLAEQDAHALAQRLPQEESAAAQLVAACYALVPGLHVESMYYGLILAAYLNRNNIELSVESTDMTLEDCAIKRKSLAMEINTIMKRAFDRTQEHFKGAEAMLFELERGLREDTDLCEEESTGASLDSLEGSEG